MIRLKSVKDRIEAIIHRLQLNYKREIAEMPLFECSLNKLFLGNPGTGKTTVAKLYGQILADIGLLSNGEVIIKTPSELIGDALGQSERNTKAILDSTKGKVLIIDEAYMLGSRDKSASTTDAFRAGVIDTIVGEIQSTAVEDRCVLLVGYRDRMESMLNEVNPALARRFPLASAFSFEDYSQGELEEILNVKLGSQGLKASNEAKTTAIKVISRSRNRPGFGNAGEVDILLDQANLRQHRRLLVSSDTSAETDPLLLPSDFHPDFERGSRSLLDIKLLFEDFVLQELVVRNMKAAPKRMLDGTVMIPLKDPREMIPFTFLFCGPPGTVKTTTANRMGKVFYDMGFLAAKDVIECSATDLIGEYVGHTGPKTKRIFDTSLGRVLFLDEAYKLAEGPYGKEAMVEIVNNLAKDNYRNKLVVILAGDQV
ncbi:P-loop containing nucleoside triphosphate hydrolase protein [Ustulina deusta]|nr:P-loop containing nucleoside triphosphate hydrolase protein [Ustulina deusta]